MVHSRQPHLRQIAILWIQIRCMPFLLTPIQRNGHQMKPDADAKNSRRCLTLTILLTFVVLHDLAL